MAGAGRAEQVMPWCRPCLAVWPEPAQHANFDQHGEAVPGRDYAAEPGRGELAGGEHPVLAHQADKAAVAVGQVRRDAQQLLIGHPA
jgi:hypothetical protein